MIDAWSIVVAVGGGYPPVVSTDEGFSGVPAVIDKDRSAALPSTGSYADLLVVLTAVDQVAISQQAGSGDDARRLPSSMASLPWFSQPKVEAPALKGFVEEQR